MTAMLPRQPAQALQIQRLATAVGSLSATLLLTLLVVHWITSAPAPNIQVEWDDTISEKARRELEHRFQLLNQAAIRDRMWSYDLIDAATSNIAALVNNPAIVSTVFLDREALSVSPDAPPGVITTWVGDRIPILNRPGVMRGVALSLFAMVVGALMIFFATLSNPARWPDLLTRAVPSTTAEALGFYRVLFAVGLLVVFVNAQFGELPAPGHTHPANAWLADWDWVRWIVNRPTLVRCLETTITAAVLLFGLGLWTQTVNTVLAGSLWLWTLVRLHHTGTHPWAVALITVLCLVSVRWGDAFSLDETIRRWRYRGFPPGRQGKAYGLAVWLPGLVLGTAMAGAAYAKIHGGGLSWIIGGAVKYHFVTDAGERARRLGPLDRQPPLRRRWSVGFRRAGRRQPCDCGLLAIRPPSGAPRRHQPSAVNRIQPLPKRGLACLVDALVVLLHPWGRLFNRLSTWVPAHIVLVRRHCRQCTSRARILHALDWFNAIKFIDSDDDTSTVAVLEQVDRPVVDLHVGNSASEATFGYVGWNRVLRSIPIAWPMVIVGSIPPFRFFNARPHGVPKQKVEEPIDQTPRPRASVRARADVLPLARMHYQAIVLVCLLQLVASTFQFEQQPLLSNYPMYSLTYASTDAFDNAGIIQADFRFRSRTTASERDVSRVLETVELDGPLRDAILSLAAGESFSAELRERVRWISEAYRERTGKQLGAVTLLRDELAFDWSTGRLHPKAQNKEVLTLDTTTLEVAKFPSNRGRP